MSGEVSVECKKRASVNVDPGMALAEVDKAPFGWYHVRLAVVTGIGFFTDAYSVSSTY